MAKITLPHNYTPRDYQLPLMEAIDNGFKRLVCVWHRRAGKDKTLINIMAKEMVKKVGTYFYFTPTYNQGRKILWNGIDKDGFKFLHHIPVELIKNIDKQQMFIELVNGSVFQIIGTDNVDSVVGTNPIGCIFSEYSLQNPIAWGYIRPILAENGGWAIFNYTSRGRNHGYTLLEYAKKQKDWFVSVLTAKDTAVFTEEQLNSERDQYLLEDGDDMRFHQEYMCSFAGSIRGSYWGSKIQEIQEKNQIKDYIVETNIPVNTYWDLGVGDSTAIWFTQLVGNEVRVIDYLENSGVGLDFYIKELQNKPYTYKEHFAPHDIQVREFTTGTSRLETARKLGIHFRVLPNLKIDDGIQAARVVLSRCFFHETNTAKGLDALRNYHKEWDDKNKCYSNRPKHDWSSHGADAFRYLAISGVKPPMKNNFTSNKKTKFK